jgi:hypothetical protein
MATRSRIRRVIDFGRLRDALAGPGSDPRTWVCLARIDTVDGAVRWEEGVGWVADVTISSGELAQEGPIPCRIPASIGGAGLLLAAPVVAGSEVLVSFPDGDPNVAPVLLGYLHGAEDQPLPDTVNGQTIDAALAEATTILVSNKNVEAQVGASLRVAATDDAKLLAQNVALADDAAGQAFVRGDDQLSALNDLVDALDAFAQSLATAIPAPPNGALTVASVLAAYTTLAPALASAKTALQSALSSRIKGE